MRWIERSIRLPLPPGDAFPLAVEPGTMSDWLVQLQEVRPRGFLHFRPRVRHGGVRLDLDVEVLRVAVPEEVEAAVRWREIDGRLHLLLVATEDGGTLLTLRVGLVLTGVLRGARPLILAEIARLLTWDLRRLRRLAVAEARGERPDTGDDLPEDAHASPHRDPADAGSGPRGSDAGRRSGTDEPAERAALDPADDGPGARSGEGPAPDAPAGGDADDDAPA